VAGIFVGGWITDREVRRRGGDPSQVWDALLWVIPAGIVGSRLWFVVNDILGGGTRYLENPASIINIPAGGLHIYGGILFGGLAAFLYCRRYKLDMWLILDSVAPALLVGQAVARPANFINQELYGPPTDLPWGISISAEHRILPWSDLNLYPEETTRFHPTFAYEIIWNFLTAVLLLWLARRFSKKMRPGVAFAGWLILAGLGRVIIETFRPDQPRLPGTDISFSRIVAGLMAVAGILFLLIKYEVLRLPFLSTGPASYVIVSESPQPVSQEPKEHRKQTASEENNGTVEE
jgi:phosphatidylglycerol:prolipoprotein diacylglycerol transferase